MGLVLKPAKCGCEGCIYEHEDKCPGDDEPSLSACTKEDTSMIFVEEGDNNGSV